jgi:hypothetical protein
VQDAFVKAWRALDRFTPGAPFRPWLLTIVANEARNRRRGSGRRAAVTLRAQAMAVPAGPAVSGGGDGRPGRSGPGAGRGVAAAGTGAVGDRVPAPGGAVGAGDGGCAGGAAGHRQVARVAGAVPPAGCTGATGRSRRDQRSEAHRPAGVRWCGPWTSRTWTSHRRCWRAGRGVTANATACVAPPGVAVALGLLLWPQPSRQTWCRDCACYPRSGLPPTPPRWTATVTWGSRQPRTRRSCRGPVAPARPGRAVAARPEVFVDGRLVHLVYPPTGRLTDMDGSGVGC